VPEAEEETPEEPTVAAGLVLQLRELGLQALALGVIGGCVHLGPLGPKECLLGGAGVHEARHALQYRRPAPGVVIGPGGIGCVATRGQPRGIRCPDVSTRCRS